MTNITLLSVLICLSCGGNSASDKEPADADVQDDPAADDDVDVDDPEDADVDVDVDDPADADVDADSDDTGDPSDVDGGPDDSGDAPPPTDLDGDGFSVDDGDCNDDNFRIHPGADEVCNEIDDDCDTVIDEDPIDGETFFADLDGDGFGDAVETTIACSVPDGFVENSSDCAADDASTYPGAVEVCDDLDNDCDAAVDEEAIDMVPWYLDADLDGFGDDAMVVMSCDPVSERIAMGGDCDDSEVTVFPGAAEFCDGIDNDCDGVIDDDAIFGTRTWFRDKDGDGYGDADFMYHGCGPRPGWVVDSTDCDDELSSRYPGNAEACDRVDNDCDSIVDEDDVCLSCDVDYPTPLTVVEAGASVMVDGGSAECTLSGYDYTCDNCDDAVTALGVDAELVGAYDSFVWVVTSGSASVTTPTSLSTMISLSGASVTEPDECDDSSYTVELQVTECSGSIRTDSLGYTVTCCGVD
jgi:hypothetical protein